MNPFALTAEERAGAMMAPARTPDVGAFMDNLGALRAMLGPSVAQRMVENTEDQKAWLAAGNRGPRPLTEDRVWLADDVAGALLGPIGMAGVIKAYHGSPHRFSKFSMDKIGTGEGAQAYGHGLYLAEAQDVAQSYIPKSGSPSWRGKTVNSYGMDGSIQYADGTIGKVSDAEWGAFRKAMESGPRTGNLYKVDLPDDAIARMLDWDKPLSQQAPGVQKAVQGVWDANFIKMVKSGKVPALADANGSDVYTALGKSPEMAAQLRQAGIPGIRYLDGGSRGAGSGTSNYVVFPGEEALLTILERNGIPLP